MSEPITGRGLRFIYNSLLLTTSCLTARKISSLNQKPFAFAACMVGGAVALIGLIRVLFGSELGAGTKTRDVSQGILELVPLPLINMELYKHSLGLGSVVLAHGICILPPLLLDLRCSLVKERKECDISETFRDLFMLGNIVSILFLAVKEHNCVYMQMGLTMMVVKYYPVLMDTAQEESGEDLIICGTALLFHQLGKTLS